MMGVVRVAYTVEQCWHRVPGGTGVAALQTASALLARGDVDLVGVAGTHAGAPGDPWCPPMPWHSLPGSGAKLYASWLWGGRPPVERATGPVDVAHATSIIPCASRAPLVVTVHDLAFLRDPAHFTRWGTAVFRRSLAVIRRRAALVLCSSPATMDDCVAAGISADRLRHIPLGVRTTRPSPTDIEQAKTSLGLPDRYLAFVGTLEPRKNIMRLVQALDALDEPLPLVAVGPAGWGPGITPHPRVRLLGHVAEPVRNAVVAGAEAFCYPSTWEGFGLPVAEAMALGTPVVTSRATATETTAGGAAQLVDPYDPADIARGIDAALADRDRLVAAGLTRARELTWERTAELTVAAYAEAAS